MQIRIANWNVNRRADLSQHRELMDSLGWDVCTLQAVGSGAAAAAAGTDGLEGSHALDHVAGTAALAGVVDGAMVVARAPFRLRGAGVVADLPSPDRSLLARVGHDEQRYFGMSVLSAALPPATSWGALKVERCLGLVRLLERSRAPMLVGIDANTPKIDHVDEDRVEYWWPEEAELLVHARRISCETSTGRCTAPPRPACRSPTSSGAPPGDTTTSSHHRNSPWSQSTTSSTTACEP